jgi:hypothetical protein
MDKIESTGNGYGSRKRTLILVAFILMALPVLEMISMVYMDGYLKQSRREVIVVKDSIRADFVSNDHAGPLFVITGQVRNQTDAAVGLIRVRADLYTDKRVLKKSRATYCDNILTPEVLKSATVAEIDSLLADQDGNSGRNLAIEPGDSISFMIVIADLPPDMVEYEVVIDSVAAPVAAPADSQPYK